jgi:hypothetical protein
MVQQESVESIFEAYPAEVVREAKRMIDDGTEAHGAEFRGRRYESDVSGVTVIVCGHPAKDRMYYCTECGGGSCAHCLLARIRHASKGYPSEAADLRLVEDKVRRFWDLAAEALGEIVQTEGACKDRCEGDADRDEEAFDAAQSAAEEVCEEIFDCVGDIRTAVDMIESMAEKAGERNCSEAVYEAVRQFRELVRCRLSGILLDDLADLILKRKSAWLLPYLPELSEKDKGYLVQRLTEEGIPVSDLKEKYPDLLG